MAKPSLARELFDRIQTHSGHADSVAYLGDLVNPAKPPNFETEFLDFKAGQRPGGTPLPDNDIKKTWSEALAGFATTSGGVLIWGIDARKDPATNVDAARALNLVIDPNALKSRLQELHHQATDPPIPGVEILALPDSNAGGQGFVVCFVPESEYKPHRAESANKRWLIRIGDSFVDVPVSVLRSLFFPQRNSYVFIRVARTGTTPSGNKLRATYRVRLYNEGPATADNVLLVVRHTKNLKVVVPTRWKSAPSPDGWRVHFPEPLHPGQMFEGCDIQIEFTGGVEDVEFEFQLYATDQMPNTYKIEVPASSASDHHGQPQPLPTDRFR